MTTAITREINYSNSSCQLDSGFHTLLTTDPFFLRYSWRTPAIVTVKFTTSTKYPNSCAHRFSQTYQHHQLHTNYNGWQASNVSVMDVLALRCTDCQFLA